LKTSLDAWKAHETVLWAPLIVAAVVAAVSSFAAVRWMLGYVRSHTFAGFGWYRIGAAVLLITMGWRGSH
jgi:undecaprenyl-diphosphatase